MMTWNSFKGFDGDDMALIFDQLPDRKKLILSIVIPNYKLFVLLFSKGSFETLEKVTSIENLLEIVDNFLSDATEEDLFRINMSLSDYNKGIL